MRIYYPGSLRLQVFVGKRFIEDLNRLDGKSKEQLFLDKKISSNNDEGGYTAQTVSVMDRCSIGGLPSDPALCMTDSNIHGANSFDRSSKMLDVLVSGHAKNRFVEIKAMPVVAVSMGVQTSVSNFYKIKDAFLSTLASTLGIDVTRITVVDVVAGNARRRRGLLAQSAVVKFEVEPSPKIEITSEGIINVLEDAINATIEITRSVNIVGDCAVWYSVLRLPSDSAVAGVNFITQIGGMISFKSKEDVKTISVEILSEAGYRPDDVQFSIQLEKAENATLGKTQLSTVIVHNAHMPAPEPPRQASSGTSTTGVMVEWSPVTWALAPSAVYNTTRAWRVECAPDGDWSSSMLRQIEVSANVFSYYFSGLAKYTKVLCRARVQSDALLWTEWSINSLDMYTLPVCGDGDREGSENCDDGGTSGGDGCSDICEVFCVCPNHIAGFSSLTFVLNY